MKRSDAFAPPHRED